MELAPIAEQQPIFVEDSVSANAVQLAAPAEPPTNFFAMRVPSAVRSAAIAQTLVWRVVLLCGMGLRRGEKGAARSSPFQRGAGRSCTAPLLRSIVLLVHRGYVRRHKRGRYLFVSKGVRYSAPFPGVFICPFIGVAPLASQGRLLIFAL